MAKLIKSWLGVQIYVDLRYLQLAHKMVNGVLANPLLW